MSKYYKQAIDLLNQDHNWKSICFSIAKNHPKVFCDACNDKPLFSQIREIYMSEGKPAAIKFARNETGQGLKESKQLIEELCE